MRLARFNCYSSYRGFWSCRYLLSGLKFYEPMNLIQGHAFLHVLSPFDAYLDSLHIDLALVSAAHLGVGWKGGFSFIMLNPLYGAVVIWLFGFFTRYSTPWIFACTVCSAVSDLDIFLRGSALFLRFLFFPNIYDIFGGGSEVVREFSNCSRSSWLVCTVRSPWESLLLLTGHGPSDRSSSGASFGLLIIPKFPIFLGIIQGSWKN